MQKYVSNKDNNRGECEFVDKDLVTEFNVGQENENCIVRDSVSVLAMK